MTEIVPDKSGHLSFGRHKIYWEYHGTGEREAVCLLNGLAMHTPAWYWCLPELTDEFDVILYDYLGQGQSSCPDEPYSIPDFCHYLTGIINVNSVSNSARIVEISLRSKKSHTARNPPVQTSTITVSFSSRSVTISDISPVSSTQIG